MTRETVILTIDDDRQIRFALDALFRLQGWSSFSAGGVEEGIELFREKKPDIILIDYHMPHINGVEGVRMLRALSPKIPIIVFTIDESQDVADAFLDAGASDFALKPIKAPDIVSRIRLHLRLLESEQLLTPLEKGISQNTYDLLLNYMKSREDYQTVNEIADGIGIAHQTVYRYLQYMLREDIAQQLNSYGKVGRPKQLYRLKKI